MKINTGNLKVNSEKKISIEDQLKKISENEDILTALKMAYNLGVLDSSKTAKVEIISDHISMAHAAKHFAVDKETILNNTIKLGDEPEKK